MEICNVFQINRKEPIVIALGVFDGVHIGHRKLIDETKLLANELKAKSAVFTFDNREEKYKKANEIYNFAEREYILEKVIVYKWNRKYPADQFFSFPLKERNWRLIQATEFTGYSHEKITEEIYFK